MGPSRRRLATTFSKPGLEFIQGASTYPQPRGEADSERSEGSGMDELVREWIVCDDGG